MQNVIVVVLAYGLWGTPKRSPKEIVGYGMYLRQCAQAIGDLAECGYGISVIFCGGAKEDGVTEAESMFFYFLPLTKEFKLTFHCESFSLTTPANIWQAYEIIEKKIKTPDYPDQRILFTCDTAREFKVRWLVSRWLCWTRTKENLACNRSWSPAREILSWPKPEVQAFDRPDITFKSTKIFQFLETLVLMLNPWLLKKRINCLRAG